MVYISPNVGHAFFGIVAFILACIVLYDVTLKTGAATQKDKRLFAIDRLWGPIMLATGLLYFLGLAVSLTLSEATAIQSGPGQHMVLAVFILVTSLACLRIQWLNIARIIQLFGFALVMLFHTHMHAGAAWIGPYHRLLFFYGLTLAALFLVMLLSANKKILYTIGATLFVTSLSLILYIETPHTHSHASAAVSAVNEKALSCVGTGTIHVVTFDTARSKPATLDAKLCDRITVTNNTNEPIEIESGDHENHTDYPLVTGKIINAHKSVTVNLTQPGELKLHDHISELVASPVLIIK